MKKYLFSGILVLISLFIISCKGDIGPTGITGLDGGDVITVEFQYGVLPSTGYTSGEIMDAGIDNSDATLNYGGSTGMWVGYDGANTWRSVLKFDVSTIIPANVTVKSAYLTVVVGGGDGTGAIARVYQLTRDWTEGTTTGTYNVNVSWDYYDGTGSSWTTAGGDFLPTAKSNAVTINDTGYWTFDLNTAMVQSWINDPEDNHGMIIRDDNEASGSSHYVEIATKENGNYIYAPKLTVNYVMP